jgi:hypothetical protein
MKMKFDLFQRSGLNIVAWGLALSSLPAIALSSKAIEIPEQLQVPKGQSQILKVAAKGVQIYTCKATTENASEYQWTLKAPEATLLSQQGKVIGKHYAGPTWELNDGSKAVGKVRAKVDAPQKDTIPWLLLEATTPSQSVSTGQLSLVKWVHRLNTIGGKAPQSGCDRTKQNREMRVKYSADYYFYRPAAASNE